MLGREVRGCVLLGRGGLEEEVGGGGGDWDRGGRREGAGFPIQKVAEHRAGFGRAKSRGISREKQPLQVRVPRGVARRWFALSGMAPRPRASHSLFDPFPFDCPAAPLPPPAFFFGAEDPISRNGARTAGVKASARSLPSTPLIPLPPAVFLTRGGRGESLCAYVPRYAPTLTALDSYDADPGGATSAALQQKRRGAGGGIGERIPR